jgi:hypothetical protein
MRSKPHLIPLTILPRVLKVVWKTTWVKGGVIFLLHQPNTAKSQVVFSFYLHSYPHYLFKLNTSNIIFVTIHHSFNNRILSTHAASVQYSHI